jgi:hypothetical protein
MLNKLITETSGAHNERSYAAHDERVMVYWLCHQHKIRSNFIIPVVYGPFYSCYLGTEKESGLKRRVRFLVVLSYKYTTLKLN